ncbi:Rho-GTPase-activating protein 8 [Ophidiomyces ophidiicola]|uniref:Rho-GTPase-activating protein 8 n=1 Tax=Ophidiomyces ophidiicola TaxID=1387563 RepID=A0ACB8V208_9EURO|nr:Rho-GTPase-activating protein 8 [Ophidiomyces ophidiicola]KAI1906351.1 Rho-GTPase-activating protein 8 [Ophidiomyces ophidiicola]KAI1911547.1 Rho-GTPase-activating protein 8 [Ophidiomyces ophidiicola]KAI1921099.1 Rho-GTPase-activating protein 8 [Ophidiomyces ophidiicola]KAI1935476.1 Rho-GTPase-activating protein 8 [Ophidiomyces ophidiicola]KAI1946094.1 Rho-GTPase-activating protein 8 [Ophidiomyces ophidiicola]
MPGFADSFWSPDYASGLGVLFSKLQQGIVENQQILAIARMRADAEQTYGAKLGDIAPSVDRMPNGFSRDDGASVRKAYEGIRSEMIEGSKNHQKIASSIRDLVVTPFGRWAAQHEMRISNSQDELQARVKEHSKQTELVKKLRSQYFNKCRLVEDLEEENKLAFQDPDKDTEGSPKPPAPPTIVLPDTEEEPEPVELGDQVYLPDQLKKLLTHMLETIKIGESKVPILGTYLNTSTGADIVDYIQKHLNASSMSYAERIGQDMVDNGFLRLIGNVGSTFANSSKMNYQWRPKVFQLTGIPEKKKPLLRVSSLASGSDDNADSPTVAEIISGWNPLNNPYPNETPAEKLRREARESDERYKVAVKKLDRMRCSMEEEVVDYLKFMERCELDRLRAIKAVVLDFSGAISNVIPSLRSTVDQMMLYQETIQPLGDLRYLLENYRTGAFVPRVQPYENYYGSVEDQTFGVDLEARARADRKRVPVIVTSILTYLDNRYPDLEGDEARRAIWLHEVPLSATHHLRNALNNGQLAPPDLLDRYEIPVIASVLKLYLLELPDSLVSSQVYEIVRTIYTATSDASDEGRVKVLQNTLGQLRLNNIATLDAIITHFTRLIDLTSADDAYITSLAQNLAPCVLRPRVESNLTMDERHNYRLLRDLFDHKDEIFGELKRQASSLGTLSNSARPRAISSDESNRRANTEARNRAIASRSRATSPAPGYRHRRDRSTGGSESTRFPINVGSPTTERRATRQSLEVPGSLDSPVVADSRATDAPSQNPLPNGGSSTSASDEAPAAAVAKSNSLSRSSGRYSRVAGLNRDSNGNVVADSAVDDAPEQVPPRPVGVTLEDKPMDD